MPETSVTVNCPACSFRATFSALGHAREALATHQSETGHDPTWAIDRLAPGVEQAGADAGVCGIPGTEHAQSPLVHDVADHRDNADLHDADEDERGADDDSNTDSTDQ